MQDDEAKTETFNLFSKLSVGYLLILYLTPFADLIDLVALVLSLLVCWLLSKWFSGELAHRLGHTTYYIFIYLFVGLFTVRLNRVSNYGLDSDYGFSKGMIPLFFSLSIVFVILVGLGVSVYLLFRLRIKGIVLMIVPFVLTQGCNVGSHVTRQMVAQYVYDIDIKKAVVTKIPYGDPPITLTFENGIPVVNDIMLPHGSWRQGIPMSSSLIHMFYEGEEGE